MHTYTIHNNHKIWGAHDLLSRPEVISDPTGPSQTTASRHSAPLEPEGIYFLYYVLTLFKIFRRIFVKYQIFCHYETATLFDKILSKAIFCGGRHF